MNAATITIQQTPTHTTFDGLSASYAVCRDALTGRRVAMFQVVDLGEAVTQYRTMDRRSMPPDFTFDDAIKLAMADERTRRGNPPPMRRQPEPVRQHPDLRHIRPMQLPPARGFRHPLPAAHPMRRLLCERLAERYAAKGAA